MFRIAAAHRFQLGNPVGNRTALAHSPARRARISLSGMDGPIFPSLRRPRGSWHGAALAALLFAGLAGCRGQAGDPEPTLLVFAASDLQVVLPQIATVYERSGGSRLVLVFGSSGNLAAQIASGAPADVYLAANERFVDDLIAGDHLDGESRTTYARGRLALVAAQSRPSPKGLRDLLGAEYELIAIANPEHAPYGTAAREALAAAGVWDELAPRLVFAENIVQTMHQVRSGNADAGIVALSLFSPDSEHGGTVVDESLHSALRQTGATVTGSAHRDEGMRFLTFLMSGHSREILTRYGFLPPDGR